jgi:hypothetical protein
MRPEGSGVMGRASAVLNLFQTCHGFCLFACLMLLGLVTPAAAEIVTSVAGWTIVYHVTGEPTTTWFGEGSYLFMAPQGTVYLERGGNWTYIGRLGEVTLPEGFPKITLPADGQATQVMVVPPTPPVISHPTGDCIMAAATFNLIMNGKPVKVIKGTTGTIAGSGVPNASTLQVRWDFGRDLAHGAAKVVTDQVFPVHFQSVTECE